MREIFIEMYLGGSGMALGMGEVDERAADIFVQFKSVVELKCHEAIFWMNLSIDKCKRSTQVS